MNISARRSGSLWKERVRIQTLWKRVIIVVRGGDGIVNSHLTPIAGTTHHRPYDLVRA